MAQCRLTWGGGTIHERCWNCCRNTQARGDRVSFLLSPQPLDRGLRGARHPADSVPARARRRRPGGRLYPHQARQAQRRLRCAGGPGHRERLPGRGAGLCRERALLVIPAGLPLARQYVRPVFRAADVYRPITKWSAMAHSVQELPDLLRRAYHALRSGKGGPVLIEIPPEVWEAEYKGELDYRPIPVQR